MADSETQSASRQCPDTGQTVPESSDETEVTSASGEATNGSSNDSPAYESYPAVKPAKFVPTISAPSMNPFAARPTLKSDVVSTSGINTGAPNHPKFVLRPSALSAHPLNNKNDVCGADTGSTPTLLKPAKLPDPTKGLTKESEVTEKENKDSGTVFGAASSVFKDSAPPPDSGGENLFQAALKEHTDKKLPDSSCSPSKSNSAASSSEGEHILGQNLTEKVTGVHTSPKGLVSSSGFVFGENLAERVQFNIDSNEKSEDNGVASPDSTDQSDSANNAEREKTLEESAREYQETHKRETQLEEVEVVTGEENESNVLQTNGKLFVFDGDNQNWLERGRGLLRLNDMRCESSQTFQSRLIMRTQGSLRVILNTKIWPGMTVERASQKSVRVTGTDEVDQVKVFLIMTNPKDSENLLRALDWRVQQLRVQEDKLKDSGVKVAEKRKAEPESPTEEFTIKKTKKSDDEAQASYKREESDSSVVDPETEVSSESHASSFTLRTDSD